MSPLAYLIRELKAEADPGAFTKEYSKLAEADKNTLKTWAQEEMGALKIT